MISDKILALMTQHEKDIYLHHLIDLEHSTQNLIAMQGVTIENLVEVLVKDEVYARDCHMMGQFENHMRDKYWDKAYPTTVNEVEATNDDN